MTRASHSAIITATYQRRTSGTHPQWMRALEEKYQKLHKKVTENTMGTRFRHSVGRSVYDVRLTQASMKHRDPNISKLSLKPNQNSKRSDTYVNDGVVNTDNAIELLQTEKAKQTLQNQYLDRNELHRSIHKDEESGQINEQHGGKSAGHGPKSALDTPDHVTWFSKDSFDDCQERVVSVSEDGEDDKVAGDGGDKVVDTDLVLAEQVHDPVITYDAVKADIERETDEQEEDVYNRTNLKTSLSRTSKFTSKSCPAKIQSQKPNRVHKPLLARSKSAQKAAKMFTPMSEEAKHAITETIHEMNVTDNGKGHNPNNVRFIPTQSRKMVKTWAARKQPVMDTKQAYDAKNVLESVSQRFQSLNDDGVPANNLKDNSLGTDESCRSSAGSAQRNNPRLPEIQHGSVKDKVNLKSSSFRIPGVGKYNISQVDSTFEITPPGFDIRYEDVRPVEERDSETPPPDIRQLAIDKCSEWLVKYNK